MFPAQARFPDDEAVADPAFRMTCAPGGARSPGSLRPLQDGERAASELSEQQAAIHRDGLAGHEERSLHIRAQRFARTKVAEMQLYKPELCQKGNDSQDVYLYLKHEIDSAREGFRSQFMTIPTMVDYLHLELVSSLVHGDEFLLGADYPGQMQ